MIEQSKTLIFIPFIMFYLFRFKSDVGLINTTSQGKSWKLLLIITIAEEELWLQKQV